jgi:protein-tyrosine phosphatase
MTHHWKHAFSLTVLALTLGTMSSPIISGLAATPSGNTTSAPGYDPDKMPTSFPREFAVPAEPAAGEPGSRLKLSVNSGKTQYNNNTRELGGYVTADGKWKIKNNRLLRSAKLAKLSDDDVKILQQHNVKHIVDFRTAGQVSGSKDKVIPGASWENISIFGRNADSGYNLVNNEYVPGKTSDGGFYNHQLEFSASALTGYHQFLTGLLSRNGATLFHCNSGKDRTGIASFLIMSALGMSANTIATDYMLSQTYGQEVHFSWIKEYFREINIYYTNMPHYLVEGLNFSKYQQELLKSQYLVSTDGQERAYPAPASPAPTIPMKPEPDQKPTTTQPAQPSTPQPTAPKRKQVKVLSVKKLKKTQYVHLKNHRPYFYDMHLKHKVGLTGKSTKAKWRLLKRAKIRVNNHTMTYFQIKGTHGHHRWIQSNAIHLIRNH